MEEQNKEVSKSTIKKQWETPRLTELETNLTEGKNSINNTEQGSTTGPS